MAPIDYSKTKIYKIQCRDESVQEVFYGHSTKMSNMKYYLKSDIENGKNTPICNTIRKNGGIEQWDIIVIESYIDCKNKEQANYRVATIKSQNNPEKTIQNNPITIQNNPATIQVNLDNDTITQKSETPGSFNCKLCNKTFTLKTNLYRHAKYRCIKTKSTNENETPNMQLNQHEEKIKKLEEHIKEQDDKIKEQDEKIKKLEQNSIVTTQNNNNTVNNITQNNTTNNNNNIQNNIIFELGNENFEQVLTDQQKLQILNQKYSSIEYFIKKYHCNKKYPQFQNVKITSMTKSHCEVYSKNDKKYITKDLKDVIEQLVDCRIGDLNIILDETPNVPENTNIAVRGLFEKMDTDEEYKKEKYKKVKMTMYSEFRNKQL
jgi:hypothetical protein